MSNQQETTEIKQMNVKLPKSIKTELDIYCAANGVKQKNVVASAFEAFLKKDN